MQIEIKKSTVDNLIAGKYPDEDTLADTKITGFQARLLPSGKVTFGLRYRNEQGERKIFPLGLYGNISPDQARTSAKIRAGEVAKGQDVHTEKKQKRKRDGKTVDAVLDLYETEYSDKLKSGFEVKRAFKVYVRPIIGSMVIYDVKRSAIKNMLRKIGKDNGLVQADRVLAHLRAAFNWFAVEDEDFKTPIVKRMGISGDPQKRRRKRTLDAQEIRDTFLALDECHAEHLVPFTFRPFVHMLFFTTLRLRMVSNMHRDEIDGRDWIIPEERNKPGCPFLVTLSDTMLALTKNNNSPFVFSSDNGTTAFKGFSKAKAALDKKLADIRKRDGRKPMPHWTFHDLRRTGRFLMGQNGVMPDHAERALGHIIGGVRGVYDPNEVYAYRKEKQAALEVLERVTNRVLRPGGKVVAFPKRA
jgi:integrase